MEIEQKVNFGQYWTRFIKPDGVPALAVGFDREKFAEKYGEEVAIAYGNYRHYMGNPPLTTEAEEAQRRAKETIISIMGITPDIIDQGRENPQVEDLSEH